MEQLSVSIVQRIPQVTLLNTGSSGNTLEGRLLVQVKISLDANVALYFGGQAGWSKFPSLTERKDDAFRYEKIKDDDGSRSKMMIKMKIKDDDASRYEKIKDDDGYASLVTGDG